MKTLQVTAELKELRRFLGIGERIQRRSEAVNETVEDLEQQLVDTKEPEKKEEGRGVKASLENNRFMQCGL